jgi:hypothetical protein
VRLNIGSYKTKFGPMKKPVISIIGKVEIEGGDEQNAFDDEVPF